MIIIVVWMLIVGIVLFGSIAIASRNKKNKRDDWR